MQLKNKLNDFFSSFFHFMLEQCANDIVASTFVHGWANMKADREYLSPLRAMIGRCSLRAHSAEHRLWCWSRADVQSLTIALCSRCHRSPCGWKASGYAERF